MKKIGNIFLIGALLLLCACGGGGTAYQYSRVDVSAKNEEAQSLYDSGKYEESLELFLDAMQEEPKNVPARIGVVKSQIALENYDMALMNLDMAVPVLAHEEEMYDLYIQVSELTDNISVARTAVDLAKRYGEESFLERVPAKPVLGAEGGKYSRKLEVSVTAPDTGDAEIYISVDQKDGYQYNDIVYKSPWMMTTGETKLLAYCVKDGIPSETAEAVYLCEYGPTAVRFADPVMEQLVRNTLDKQEGEITDLDCEKIRLLDCYKLQSDGMDYEEYRQLKIKSLEDLKYFPNLTSLGIEGQTEISDYSQVSLCPGLYSLSIGSNELTDISFLSNLPCLSYLYLEDNQIEDVQPLLQCRNLRGLEIEDNPVDNLSELMQMKKLYRLYFDAGQFHDVAVLGQWKNLTELRVYYTGKDDLSVIGNMTQLVNLLIDHAYWEYDGYGYGEDDYIKDISYLENLTNLTYLNISGLRDLSQIGYLKNLTKLQNLYLHNRYDREHGDDDEAAVKELQKALPGCNISY